MKPLSPTWDLESIFSGGSGSRAFAAFLSDLSRDIAAFDEALCPAIGSDDSRLFSAIETLQNLMLRVREANGFVTCLQSQNTGDRDAVALAARVRELQAAWEAVGARFDQHLLDVPDERWSELLAREQWCPFAAGLDERRAGANKRLAPATEALIGDLAVDGYHGWSALYRIVAGSVRVPFVEEGEARQLSVAQAENRLPQLEARQRAMLFEDYEAAWAHSADVCADALNHLAGFRLRVYRQRGWDNFLQESLDANRIGEATLHSMWQAVRESNTLLARFLKRKARLLGVEKLGWPDVDVPLNAKTRRFSYQEACELVVTSFGRFDPKMAAFATRALEDGWVDAGARTNKRNGGFSKTLPLSRQSRVLLSFEGGWGNLFTLAHELGHAYHQELMVDLPALSQRHPMTVAECASTFAERLLAECARERARDEGERLALLEANARRAVNYLTNIRARFDFEFAFYTERLVGRVSVQRLNELCVSSQRAAFGDALASYHPHGWASRRHFFFTDQSFYNFPYTFGLLLSAQIDGACRAAPNGFGARYAEFLRASGTRNVEQLGHEFFDADLSRPEFWRKAVTSALRDVERFLQATETR